MAAPQGFIELITQFYYSIFLHHVGIHLNFMAHFTRRRR
jgi:hypothetical protein